MQAVSAALGQALLGSVPSVRRPRAQGGSEDNRPSHSPVEERAASAGRLPSAAPLAGIGCRRPQWEQLSHVRPLAHLPPPPLSKLPTPDLCPRPQRGAASVMGRPRVRTGLGRVRASPWDTQGAPLTGNGVALAVYGRVGLPPARGPSVCGGTLCPASAPCQRRQWLEGEKGLFLQAGTVASSCVRQ